MIGDPIAAGLGLAVSRPKTAAVSDPVKVSEAASAPAQIERQPHRWIRGQIGVLDAHDDRRIGAQPTHAAEIHSIGEANDALAMILSQQQQR